MRCLFLPFRRAHNGALHYHYYNFHILEAYYPFCHVDGAMLKLIMPASNNPMNNAPTKRVTWLGWVSRLAQATIIMVGGIMAVDYLFPTLQPAPLAGEVHLFHSDFCSLCTQQKVFLEDIAPDYPHHRFITHDVMTPAGYEQRSLFAQLHAIPAQQIGVPLLITKDGYVSGYRSPEETGRSIMRLLDIYQPEQPAPPSAQEPAANATP